MNYWIIPCNLKYYDVFASFEVNKIIDWKQSNPNISVGDDVFIYVGAPVQSIMFRCKVLKSNMPKREIDDSKFERQAEKYENHSLHMRIQLITQYDSDILSYSTIQSYGEKGRIMCQRRMGENLRSYVDEIKN